MTIQVVSDVANVSIHGADSMTANRGGTSSWLTIKTMKGELAHVFMPYEMAEEIADLWKWMNREPEPPTFDEALGAKCDAERRLEEARALK